MKTNIILLLFATIFLSGCINVPDYDDNRAYEYKIAKYKYYFESKYGEIPQEQSWDFFTSEIASSRANNAVSVTKINQPSNIDFTYWQNYLVSGENNFNIGTHNYSLISNGNFNIYAVWYAGWYEYYSKYKFEFGIKYNNKYYKVFGTYGSNAQESNVGYSINPKLGASVTVPTGKEFKFYIKYTLDNKQYTYESDDDNSTLLYSDMISDKKVMVIGFEDSKNSNSKDFNDIILYVEGNPELPTPNVKRFMCEDLGGESDFDFNDVVFDVMPDGNKTDIIIQAAGGTLPLHIFIGDTDLGEVHELFGVSQVTMVNTGSIVKDPVKITLDKTIDSDFTDVKIYVNDLTLIPFSGTGQAPCMFAVPISVSWMKERQPIDKGYPNFFKTDWYKTYDTEYLYQN